jgi:tRNA G46 methylase TrmB
MANPFSESLSLLEEIEEMKYKIPEIYSDNSRPIHIDVGCAKGGCIESLSFW